MQINSTVVREDKFGYKTEFFISNQAQLDYHRQLQQEGFKYIVKPVIHMAMNVCVSCEG